MVAQIIKQVTAGRVALVTALFALFFSLWALYYTFEMPSMMRARMDYLEARIDDQGNEISLKVDEFEKTKDELVDLNTRLSRGILMIGLEE